MKTYASPSVHFDARVKPCPFPGMLTRYEFITKKRVLTIEQIKECLDAKMPPIATAAKYLYPSLEPVSATAKLHSKIRNVQGRKLNPQEQEKLSEIVLKLRRF